MDTKDKVRSGNRPRTTTSQGSNRTAVKKSGAGQVKRTPPRRTAAKAQKSAVRKPMRTRRTTAMKRPTPDVVYVQPGPFNKYRFLLYLATVVAVVLALLFGMSIFFKVKTVTVIGNEKYTAWEVRQASGILDGENLLTISEPKISSNIKSKLPYADYIRVGIKLPDTVKIEIVELDVVYAVEATDSAWWLIRSDGGVVEKINSADAEQYTKILGIKLDSPKQGETAVAVQPMQENENGETVPITQLASGQLELALSIAQFLESNGVIGDAASINVSDTTDLELWYGDRYQVQLGNSMELGYKIKTMKLAIDKLGDHDSGILDASFTIKPTEVIYTPFS